MTDDKIEFYISSKDKSGLYRVHMKKEISDKQLLDAILKIDKSVKPKTTNWQELIHNFLFPSAAH